MKKSNKVKMPLVFRIGLVLICASMITSHMMGGIFARYSTTATGSASAQVAKISYKFEPELTNGELYMSSHPLDTNDVPAECSIVAFEETFTLINDGEVAYDYELTLSLTDESNRELTDYQITSISNSAWVASTKIVTVFETGKFYYYVGADNTLKDSTSPTLSGTLGIGEQVEYRILYFVSINTAEFNQKNLLRYNITCTQID